MKIELTVSQCEYLEELIANRCCEFATIETDDIEERKRVSKELETTKKIFKAIQSARWEHEKWAARILY